MTSSKQLAVSEEFNERVSKKVKDVFMDLLPEEVFHEMVSKEMTAFFEESVEFEIVKGESGGFSRPSTPDKIVGKVSPFRLIVWEVVNELVREKTNEFIYSDDFKTEIYHNEFGQQQTTELNEFLDKKLEDFAMRMARNMFKDLFAAAVTNAQQAASMEVNTALANRGY